MITTTTVTRSFLFKGTTLPDPDPSLTPKQVAQRYAHQFPELVSAEPLPAKIVNGAEITEFKENFGTKG
jgi:PRTRC genetic system protein C